MGGGGYSGGVSGNNNHDSCAGGGASFNFGKKQTNVEAMNDQDDGYVEIKRVA